MTEYGKQVAAHLVATLSTELDGDLEPGAVRRTRLAEWIDAAQAAWPAVRVGPEVLAAWLAERAGSHEELVALLQSPHGADLYLACALSQGEANALAAFEQQHVPAVAAVLDQRLRGCLPTVDELTQLVRERVVFSASGTRPALIVNYAGRGPLKAWLRIVALRMAYREINRYRSASEGPAVELLDLPEDDDPELAVLRMRHRAEFQQALEAAVQSLSPRERTLLAFHLVDGLDAAGVAAVYDVHRTTAGRWLTQAQDKLRKRVRSILATQLSLSPKEVDSLLRATARISRLTLQRVLEAEGGEDLRA